MSSKLFNWEDWQELVKRTPGVAWEAYQLQAKEIERLQGELTQLRENLALPPVETRIDYGLMWKKGGDKAFMVFKLVGENKLTAFTGTLVREADAAEGE